MNVFGRLALLFVVVPLVELALLVQMGRWIGLWPTVALVFATGVLGAALARAEGMRTLWSLQQDLGEGRLPGRAILDGAAILVGGALLLTPGLLTDVVGFSLLFPPTRRLLQRWGRRRIERMIERGDVHVFTSSGPMGRWGGGDRDPGRGEGGADAPDLDPDKEIRG